MEIIGEFTRKTGEQQRWLIMIKYISLAGEIGNK